MIDRIVRMVLRRIARDMRLIDARGILGFPIEFAQLKAQVAARKYQEERDQPADGRADQHEIEIDI